MMQNQIAAMLILGCKHGYTMQELEKVMTKSLEPTGLILLVTAAGGVLRYMLQDSGLGDIIGGFVASAPVPIVVVVSGYLTEPEEILDIKGKQGAAMRRPQRVDQGPRVCLLGGK